MARVEAERRRRAVGQQVDQLGSAAAVRPARRSPMTSGARAAELDPGRCRDLEVDPAAGGEPHRLVGRPGSGRAGRSRPRRAPGTATAGHPDRGGAVVGVDDADPHRRRRRARPPARSPDAPLTVGVAVVDVQDRELVVGTPLGIGRRRGDHQRPEQPALHLRVRDLVRVVPVRAGVVGDEPVGERLPPTGTASWVTPATPSSALGTSTPCQCSVTPSGTDALTSRTSTSWPCTAWITGPGEVPLTV